jgi:hypothetical protein
VQSAGKLDVAVEWPSARSSDNEQAGQINVEWTRCSHQIQDAVDGSSGDG